MSDIQNVIKKFPYSELSYNILGSIEMAMNELEKASKHSKAISLKDYYHAINNLGLVFYKKGLWWSNILFKKASNFDKDYTAPFLNLSAVYIDRYMLKDAQSILEKLIILNPNMHEAYYNQQKHLLKWVKQILLLII